MNSKSKLKARIKRLHAAETRRALQTLLEQEGGYYRLAESGSGKPVLVNDNTGEVRGVRLISWNT